MVEKNEVSLYKLFEDIWFLRFSLVLYVFVEYFFDVLQILVKYYLVLRFEWFFCDVIGYFFFVYEQEIVKL